MHLRSKKNLFFVLIRNDYAIVGGIKDAGNWNQAPDPANRNMILSRAYDVFPHLKVGGKKTA